MSQLNKREITRDVLELKKTNYIPVILNAVTLSAAQYGYEIPEILASPEKYTECVMGTRKKLGFDGLCGGLYMGIPASIAGHLKNSRGMVSGNGEDTIHALEDLQKLKPYDPDTCMNLKGTLANIEIMRKEQPNEPIYVIIGNPAHVAFSLMGAKNAFRVMMRNPEFFLKTAEMVEEWMYQGTSKIMEAGVDFLWIPMPNFSGYCISRNIYEKCCFDSNKRFNQRIHDAGTKLVIHTCGKYDDRMDLVLQEYGDGWHISDTVTAHVKEKYGDRVAIMGNIPCASVLMEGTPEQVYEAAFQDCMTGGKNGGFILSGDCDVSPLTPLENIKQVIRAARDAEKAFSY
ncbi:uroporphyrinogen decarboxylase family protein [Dehalobacterium formicoaceticum]|uniref:Uroporphyrinogen decarboxylase (URO-D) domain-containing protein n=1 Tax=Dehalobacterium formicoaceticum TaxID=51515 RepID=A0ABT1Y7R6_9FIRM|nr:uroporphyrinogen decarboxylase family protein [Dehalobacterium formicoaceticum]MCR6546932.1 hypothetical protein [Dehalobacterium formicoaceticum]